jgi:hypothetical protein
MALHGGGKSNFSFPLCEVYTTESLRLTNPFCSASSRADNLHQVLLVLSSYAGVVVPAYACLSMLSWYSQCLGAERRDDVVVALSDVQKTESPGVCSIRELLHSQHRCYTHHLCQPAG